MTDKASSGIITLVPPLDFANVPLAVGDWGASTNPPGEVLGASPKRAGPKLVGGTDLSDHEEPDQ